MLAVLSMEAPFASTWRAGASMAPVPTGGRIAAGLVGAKYARGAAQGLFLVIPGARTLNEG
jgi:hypothetical protein